MSKVTIELEITDPQRIAAIHTLARLFEFHDAEQFPWQVDGMGFRDDFTVHDAHGAKFWGESLPAAFAELIGSIHYLMLDYEAEDKDVLALFVLYGEWPKTIETTMQIMQRLLDLHERYDEVRAQWVAARKTRV